MFVSRIKNFDNQVNIRSKFIGSYETYFFTLLKNQTSENLILVVGGELAQIMLVFVEEKRYLELNQLALNKIF